MRQRHGDAWQTWIPAGDAPDAPIRTNGDLVSYHDDGGVTLQHFARGEEAGRVSYTPERWQAVLRAVEPLS